jgi:hypothetical protein
VKASIRTDHRLCLEGGDIYASTLLGGAGGTVARCGCGADERVRRRFVG